MSKTQKDAFQDSVGAVNVGGEPSSLDAHVLGLQVLGALLRPAAEVAERLNLPLRTVGEAAETTYFRRVRMGGGTQSTIAQTLGVSVRTVANLSRQLKRQLLADKREGAESIALTRKVEFLLWSEPLTELRIAQALPEVDAADVSRAIRTLVDEGRVKRGHGRTPLFEAVRSATRLVDRKGWLSRLDGLHSLLETVTNAVTDRFLEPASPGDGPPAAFARNLQLRVRPQDLPQLQALYEAHIFPALVALDAEANDDPEAVSMSVAYVLSAPVTPGSDT